ncbi:MAG: prepilin-type N-terminal cleavage/methylation domain-containing protein [Gammaproteobacteria bacterium]|nr:prepilin-type N-terminal cleavage/methylation domain-containing protein [Gammaproteobacteria bacterium]MDE2350074.1 prepilin-type N-terminal cleavage/methylation domain-containing protein [Gammaproteobacteria bacterium]
MTGEPRSRGFTLIELLVVLAIIGMLLMIAVPRYYHTLQRSRETILRHDLSVMRDAIDKYYGDRGGYPQALPALVDKRYLRAIPVDPITQSAATWVVVDSTDPDHPGMRDVHSGSDKTSINGTAFASW